MTFLPKFVSLGLCVGGFACASSSSGPESAPAEAEAAAKKTAEPKAAAVATMAEGISEDAFVLLHKHTDAAAPTPKGSMLTIDGDAAYLSLPAAPAAGNMPAIIMIHEWWGLNDNVRHWADRLAAEGYAVLAVDLYQGQHAETPDNAMKLMKAVDAEAAHKTLKQAMAYLRTDPAIMASRIGSIGWCFGGGWSLRLARDDAQLTAAVMYYGQTANAEELASMKAPLLGIFANQDTWITPEIVNTFEADLGKAGITHTIVRKDADHAFANPSSARYAHEPASEAWTAVRAFLAQNLKQ